MEELETLQIRLECVKNAIDFMSYNNDLKTLIKTSKEIEKFVFDMQ